MVAYDKAIDKNCLKLAAYERENVNIAYLANIGYGWEHREGRYPSRWITSSNILIILQIIRKPNLITISVYIRNNSHAILYTSNDVKFPSLVVRSSANSGYKGILSIGDYSSYSSFVTRETVILLFLLRFQGKSLAYLLCKTCKIFRYFLLLYLNKRSFVSSTSRLLSVLSTIIAWFVAIFGTNTTSDISKLLYVISLADRRVKFEATLKYHECYLCQISLTKHAIICLY